jgi:hypothetical protein
VTPDVADALLAVTWRGPGLHRVLGLFDGGAWLWELAGSEEGPSPAMVGSFGCKLTEAELVGAGELAARVDHEAADDAPDGLGVLVWTGSGDRFVPAGTALSTVVTDSVAVALERARAAPVSVVQLGALLAAPPGQAPVLGLTLRSVGSDPVTLRLDATAVTVLAADGTWRVLPPPRMGLVDATIGLLDGIYSSATIPPGGQGAWVVANIDDAASSAQVRIRGSISLAGPWGPGLAPDAPYELAASVTAR